MNRIALTLLLLAAVLLHGQTAARISSRPDPRDPAHPFDTPPPADHPASAEQLTAWRAQARAALFFSGDAPALAPQRFGNFVPMAGVTATRVTFGTQFGGRIPAIIYRPQRSSGKLPAIVVVAGHGGDKTTWYEVYAGLLYASAGAVVVTYDPIGEGERNAQQLHDARAHDTVLPGPESGAHINKGYDTEKTEAGVLALGRGFPAVTREQLQVVPEAEWKAHENLYIWQGWARHTLDAQGLSAPVPDPNANRR